MTIDRDQITEIVYSSIDELNRELGKNQRLDKSLTTALSGPGSGLDSLAVVSFQMILEEKIGQAFDVDMVLDFEEFVGSGGDQPRTVDSLVDYLAALVEQGKAAD